MQGIRYPLQVNGGDIVLDTTPEEIVISELRAIIDTRFGERVYRQDYGSPNFLLKKLNVAKLISELTLALESNLNPLGFTQIVIEVDTTLEALQKGFVTLILRFSVNEQLFNFNFQISL